MGKIWHNVRMPKSPTRHCALQCAGPLSSVTSLLISAEAVRGCLVISLFMSVCCWNIFCCSCAISLFISAMSCCSCLVRQKFWAQPCWSGVGAHSPPCVWLALHPKYLISQNTGSKGHTLRCFSRATSPEVSLCRFMNNHMLSTTAAAFCFRKAIDSEFYFQWTKMSGVSMQIFYA